MERTAIPKTKAMEHSLLCPCAGAVLHWHHSPDTSPCETTPFGGDYCSNTDHMRF